LKFYPQKKLILRISSNSVKLLLLPIKLKFRINRMSRWRRLKMLNLSKHHKSNEKIKNNVSKKAVTTSKNLKIKTWIETKAMIQMNKFR
jgi:hypothetical protein